MWVHIQERAVFSMPNKKTKALTEEQYRDIIDTMRTGFSGCRPNNRIATALVLEANLGIRISDILNLKLKDIVKDGNRYRLDIIEIKRNPDKFNKSLLEEKAAFFSSREKQARKNKIMLSCLSLEDM